ncbi:Cytochrome [Forsythia ovata]|uniref:Cytochrome n=1 Tax=Forsythia ovata TaxID=205694 RepID=A0ABD1UDH7_9LAMI
MPLSRLSRGTLFSSYLNRPTRQSPFESRHLLQAVGPRYNFYGSSNWSTYGREFRTEFRSFISVRDSNKGHLRSCNLERSSFSINLQRPYASHASLEQKSNKMLLYLTGLVFAMVGCSYAAVPLYRRFCQATGYGGTVQRRESVEEKIVRHAKEGTLTSREIAVQFNADVADGMPWKFVPTQREVRVKPGESALAFYTAENQSSTPITGVSTYNVTPMKAAVYFNKIQCFCFEEQRLLPGEQIDMPVFFYIDPEFETDPRMDGINSLILSYTFFKVSEEN